MHIILLQTRAKLQSSLRGSCSLCLWQSRCIWLHSFKTETINQTYVDGISITHGIPRRHIFTYAATLWWGSCPCRDGRPGPAFVGNSSYCGDQVLAPEEDWKEKWYTNNILWQAATGCIDFECVNDFRPWFSVETTNGVTSDPVEIRSCQDQHYPDEAIGIAHLEIYVRVD